jgi:predicted metal-dependent hydrolase
MTTARSQLQPAIQLLYSGEIQLESEGGPLAVAYRLARSNRARHLRLTINRDNEVVLTLPLGCSPERGLRFMKAKTDWLRRHLRQIGHAETLYQFLQRRGTLAVGGGEARIEWQYPVGRPFLKPGSERDGGTILIGYDPKRNDDGHLKSLLRQFASVSLPERTAALAAVHQVPINKISVRDQISRWGSCSAKKNISLNWRLLLLPPEIQDYVIWHELAHLVEMNHSNRFWALLERLDPRALVHDKALTHNTNRVMAMGRSARS